MRGLVPFDEARHLSEGIRPLNGPSAALGSREDLLRLVERLDPLDQDVVLMSLDGVIQRAAGAVLGRSQPGVSYRLSAAVRTLRHLALEPADPDVVVPEILSYLHDRHREEAEAWCLGTMSAQQACSRPQGGGNLRARVARASRGGSPLLREWVLWRLAMPARSSSANMVFTGSGSPTPLGPFPAGAPDPGRTLTDQQEEWVRDGRSRGASIKRLARLAGVSRPTLRRVIGR